MIEMGSVEYLNRICRDVRHFFLWFICYQACKYCLPLNGLDLHATYYDTFDAIS